MTAGRPELTAAEVIDLLGLTPLPEEGGWYRRTGFDERSSAIYYLLDASAGKAGRSAMHRLRGPEVWHHYAGAAVSILLIGDSAEAVRLGPALGDGERPQLIVPGDTWQGAWVDAGWALVGTTMSPPYADADFELASDDVIAALSSRNPAFTKVLAHLTP